MSRKLMALAAIGLLAAAGVAQAQDAPPQNPPNGSVFAGECLSPALGADVKEDKDEAAFVPGLLAAVVPGLLEKGFDWIGNKLAALGADKKTVLSGARTSEAAFAINYCVVLIRRAETGKTISSLLTSAASGRTVQWPNAYDPAVPRDTKVDFLVEFWVRPSADGRAIALTPTLLYYPAMLVNKKKVGSSDDALAVSASFAPVGGDGASASWAFPKWGLPSKSEPSLRLLLPLAKPDADGKTYRRSADALIRLCEESCEGASPWYKNPWPTAETVQAAPPQNGTGSPTVSDEVSGEGGAAGQSIQYGRQPMNITVTWTEIRGGSAFFKGLAEMFGKARPTLDAALQQALLSDQREKARMEGMNASATALSTYSSKAAEAETARATYCSADSTASATWQSLSAALRASQLAANAAAMAAGQSQPFAAPVSVGMAKDATLCS